MWEIALGSLAPKEIFLIIPAEAEDKTKNNQNLTMIKMVTTGEYDEYNFCEEPPFLSLIFHIKSRGPMTVWS